ncbi:MAG TPA: 7-cyano-7-deazaguanine synthase QueC [bacterium]|nr:7-cyano-7-deazaguanine synthase QueC [bacterium]
MASKEGTLVLLSGGQDSTTALFWAKKRFSRVEAVSFDYGQRHRVELKHAAKTAALARAGHTVMPVREFEAIKYSALIKGAKRGKKDRVNKKLPATFVPGRNILFLAAAASYAYTKKIHNLVIGVSQVDYSGYPDCRRGFLSAMEKALSLGLDYRIKIHAPLINKTKKETVLLAKKLGVLHYLKHTHTCYEGKTPGCGKCAACVLRAKGFEDAGVEDPLFERR